MLDYAMASNFILKLVKKGITNIQELASLKEFQIDLLTSTFLSLVEMTYISVKELFALSDDKQWNLQNNNFLLQSGVLSIDQAINLALTPTQKRILSNFYIRSSIEKKIISLEDALKFDEQIANNLESFPEWPWKEIVKKEGIQVIEQDYSYSDTGLSNFLRSKGIKTNTPSLLQITCEKVKKIEQNPVVKKFTPRDNSQDVVETVLKNPAAFKFNVILQENVESQKMVDIISNSVQECIKNNEADKNDLKVSAQISGVLEKKEIDNIEKIKQTEEIIKENPNDFFSKLLQLIADFLSSLTVRLNLK